MELREHAPLSKIDFRAGGAQNKMKLEVIGDLSKMELEDGALSKWISEQRMHRARWILK